MSDLKVNIKMSEIQEELRWSYENRHTQLGMDFIRVSGEFNRTGAAKTYFELMELKKRIRERM